MVNYFRDLGMADKTPTKIGEPIIRLDQMDVHSRDKEPLLKDNGHSLNLGFVEELIYPKHRTKYRLQFTNETFMSIWQMI